MNVDNRKVFISGLLDWQNKLMIRKNEILDDCNSGKNDNARKLYLKERVEKIEEMIFNIKQERKMQEQESRHYIGV